MVCEPRDDSTGHFNCTTDGNKVCLPGYQDPETNCVEAVITMIPTTDIIISTMETTIQTTPLSATTSTTTPVGMDIVPIAAGATVGGLVVILILIVIIIVAVLLVSRAKDKRTTERVEGTSQQITLIYKIWS